MKSIFRYPGGKTKVANWILGYMPERTVEYREAFVGGGGVFFALDPNKVASRWINDRNEGLVAVYRALAERPAEFIALCRDVAPAHPDEDLTEPGEAGNARYPRRLLEKFNEVRLNTECDQAFRYFFVNRTVFGGRVHYEMPSRLYFSKPEGWGVAHSPRMEEAATHLRGVRITCGDYEEVFNAPGEGVWIYADPPYYAEGRLTSSSQLYQHAFTKADHVRFADVVKKAIRGHGHRVAISYDDDDEGFIRGLFREPDFNIITQTWTYCGSTSDKKEMGRELLITNYPAPPAALLALRQPEEQTPLYERELTDEEIDRLDELEAAISRGLHGWRQVASALLEIKESGPPSKRLYRHLGTFEDYCKQRWGYVKSRVHQIARDERTFRNLEKSCAQDFLPTSQRQATQLSRLDDPHRQVAAWGNVVARHRQDGKKLTDKLVREEVDLALGYVRDPPPTELQKAIKALEAVRDWAPEDVPALLEWIHGNLVQG